VSTALATTVLDRLSAGFAAAADPAKAVPMKAYMRDQFAFLGIPGPAQKAVARTALAGLPKPAQEDLAGVATLCWARDEREYQYFACAYLRRFVGVADASFLDVVARLIVTRSWWDTIDTLAAHTVGPLVLRFPALLSTMDSWIGSPNIWLARTALLHQLGYKGRTDAPRLFRYCLLRAGESEFFLRKAIGWALREYAKTDPAAVRSFVEAHGGVLSGLSVREALKNL
jgi:3-methyladenine DNA glycosylase AlkD